MKDTAFYVYSVLVVAFFYRKSYFNVWWNWPLWPVVRAVEIASFHARACLLPGRRFLAAQSVRDGGQLEEGADEEQEETPRQGQDDGMEGF